MVPAEAQPLVEMFSCDRGPILSKSYYNGTQLNLMVNQVHGENCRYYHCFLQEDAVGKISRVLPATVHAFLI